MESECQVLMLLEILPLTASTSNSRGRMVGKKTCFVLFALKAVGVASGVIVQQQTVFEGMLCLVNKGLYSSQEMAHVAH
eukprot:m.184446 g.184446  ORF g.184446 m.184446 type:complete len:79 (+) comp15391_c0_seq33:165-401(+)